MSAKDLDNSMKKNVDKQVTKNVSKKKLVVSYKNLSQDVLDLLKEAYPKGYADVLMKIDKGNGQFFYAVPLNTEDTDYLIKVDVKIDTEMEQVERDLFGGGSDDYGEGEESEADFDQVEDVEDDD